MLQHYYSMQIELYLAFVAATVVLVLVPGPNVAIIVANSLTHGVRYGLICVAGVSSAQAILLSCIVFGFAAIVAALGAAFEWIRWIGVVYLIYLGIQIMRSLPEDLDQSEAPRKSIKRTFGEAVLVSATNPKVLLFYGAFFPQFVDTGRPIVMQLVLLALTFWVIGTLLDCSWALAAGRLRPMLASTGRWHRFVTGGVLLIAAAALAAVRRTA